MQKKIAIALGALCIVESVLNLLAVIYERDEDEEDIDD